MRGVKKNEKGIDEEGDKMRRYVYRKKRFYWNQDKWKMRKMKKEFDIGSEK